jgi:molybdopterin/thiamine biosynthesis adenylyltransferase
MTDPGDLDDAQLLRYSRHILLDEIGLDGQRRLLRAHALVIGAGGLGSPVVLYLAGAGVGKITVVDPDVVDLTNLQRQIAHRLASIGRPKVESAARSAAELNPEPRIVARRERAEGDRLGALVADADVVLDCSDNYATRQAVNAACVAQAKPLVAGAALRFDGQVAVWDTRRRDRPERAALPCYACVFRPDAALEETACATLGVFAPLVGIVGSMQAAEALKLLAGVGTSLAGRLQMLDAKGMEWTELRVARDPACPVCGEAVSRR